MTMKASYISLHPDEDRGQRYGVRVEGPPDEISAMTGQQVPVRKKNGEHVDHTLGRELRRSDGGHCVVYAIQRDENHPPAAYSKLRGYVPSREVPDPDWEYARAQEAYEGQDPETDPRAGFRRRAGEPAGGGGAGF
jgi:hypothetical protein